MKIFIKTVGCGKHCRETSEFDEYHWMWGFEFRLSWRGPGGDKDGCLKHLFIFQVLGLVVVLEVKGKPWGSERLPAYSEKGTLDLDPLGECASCGVPLTQEDLDYDGGRKDFCKDCN
jgi:hypothetical protein